MMMRRRIRRRMIIMRIRRRMMMMTTMKIMSKKLGIPQIDEMMRWADRDGDGLVSN